jgi:hypothetical protein
MRRITLFVSICVHSWFTSSLSIPADRGPTIDALFFIDEFSHQASRQDRHILVIAAIGEDREAVLGSADVEDHDMVMGLDVFPLDGAGARIGSVVGAGLPADKHAFGHVVVPFAGSGLTGIHQFPQDLGPGVFYMIGIIEKP